MAHKVGPAKPPIETKTALKGIVVGLVMIALAIAVPFALSSCGSSGGGGAYMQPQPEPSEPPVAGKTIVPGEGKIRLQVGETRTIKLDPNEWSPWLSLPPDVRFRIDYDGWIQPWYWSEVTPGKRYEPDSTEWLGKIPNCIFRLRGKGEATIWVR